MFQCPEEGEKTEVCQRFLNEMSAIDLKFRIDVGNSNV